MVHLNTKIKVFLLLFFALVTTVGYAQEVTITGKVTSASDGEPLIGATVQNANDLTQGTVTDLDGMFTFEIANNATIKVSYVGYFSTEVSVGNGGKLNITLEPNSELLDEVVIIGYGVQKKSDATGAVIAVDTKEFNKGAITSAADLITGKVSGVQITSNGGAPGEGSTIRIRGGSSMSASNDPLIVVDGIPLASGDVGGMRNPLNFVNPADIETFTVLKDASATAIYGSRASNGVIIITTKKSKANSPLTVSYTGNVSFSQITNQVDVLGADEYRGLVEEYYPSQVDMLSDENTNWQDEIYQNAVGTDHNVSVGGSFGILPYRLSVGYYNAEGILKTDQMERTTGSISLNPSFFDDHLKVNLNGKAMLTNNHFANRDAIGAAVQYDPTRGIYDEGNRFGGYSYWAQGGDVSGNDPIDQGSANPVALLYQVEDIAKVNRYVANAQLDYSFHFLPELHANLNVAMDKTHTEGTDITASDAAFSYDPTLSGEYRGYVNEYSNELIDFYLNYANEFDKHSINVMGGYSWQHILYGIDSTYTLNANTNAASLNPREYYNVSFFGRANYGFNDKYLVTFTLRNDGTSRFSPDTRWGLFPSLAFGWNMKNESFLKDVEIVSQMKLRAGYGITGQQNLGDQDMYLYMPRYTLSDGEAQYRLGSILYNTLRPEGYDENIMWEETETFNIGLDYGFAKDRFYGSLEFYKRITNNLINFIPIPAGTNFSNYLTTNVGNLENQGVEFSIYTRPVVRKDFLWELGFNTTFNKNEITKLTAIDSDDYLGVSTGGISGGVGSEIQMNSVGQAYRSFFVYEQVYDDEGNPISGLFVDRNEDGVVDDNDRYHYGKPAPDFMLGISSTFIYNNWTFSFSGRANFGGYVYDNVNSENGIYERLYRPEGPYLGNITTGVYDTDFTNPNYLSDIYIHRADFFRMDNMSLNYKFNDIINNNVDINLTATVNNAFVISNYDGLDPEIENGIDNRLYLRPRIFVFGVNLVF